MRDSDGILFFSPPGWDPSAGLTAAIDLLGWTCDLTSGGSAEEAIERLRAESARGPVLVGPVELGLMLHHPGSGTPIGSDHFVVVTAMAGDMVHFHDPHGHPHATMPTRQFAASWRAETVGYHPEPYTMRANFRAVESVRPEEAFNRSLPAAVDWLARTVGGQSADSGALAGAAACERLANIVDSGLSLQQYHHLGYFGIRVGVRRLADTAILLDQIGAVTAAEIADGQARLVGAMQYPLIARDRTLLARLLRQIAPTYQQMYTAMADHVNAILQSRPQAFETV
jgi:hypothetical protein